MNEEPDQPKPYGTIASLKSPIAVAVSGGSDSLALLHLCVEHFGPADVFAVTVDHGLRAEAKSETEYVSDVCATLRVEHSVCEWNGWGGRGNLLDQARRARYELISDWAKARGLATVALGHTADDLAETFLMRVGRRAGLEGLVAMAERRVAWNVEWVRPLLSVRRGALQDYLRQREVAWINDPTNEDQAYERVRIRSALPILEQAGLSIDAFAATSRQLADAEDVVCRATHDLLMSACAVDAGDIVFDTAAFQAALPEIKRRAIVHALKWVSGAEYAPRRSTVEAVLRNVDQRNDTTASGCLILHSGGKFRIARELAAVADEICYTQTLWDGRWTITGEQTSPRLQVRALGESGLLLCPHWRETGRQRAALLATPSVWHDDQLVSAPLAGMANGWRAELSRSPGDFYSSILSR